MRALAALTQLAQAAAAGRRALRVPTQCAVCLGWSGARVCAACTARHAAPGARCSRCALRVPEGTAVCGHCLRSPPRWTSACAAVDYAHPWAGLIARYKFGAELDLGDALASLLAGAAGSELRHTPSDALLLPVPLAAGRLRERGYNQSWEVARRLARRCGLRADADVLLRIRETLPQRALEPATRRANVRGAFALEPCRPDGVRGRDVVVVDDVMTTGETAAEITRVLQAGGARHVAIWVVARTPAPEQR